MIRRSFDAQAFNALINHPDVRPGVGGEGVLDLAPVVMNPANHLLMADGGGFLLVNLGGGTYEVHSQFLPEHRAGAIQAMREGMEYMFERTDCQRLLTRVPDGNLGAKGIARAGGFRELFRRDDERCGPTSFQGLGLLEWAMRAPRIDADGARFHDAIEAAKVAQGSVLPVHPVDEAHDRAVGATYRMVRAGNVQKGVDFYNSWALFAGYAPVTLISANPPVIDVVDAVVGWSGSDMEVLLCR